MKLHATMCYSHLLWLMSEPKFTQAVSNVKFSKPDINSVGMAGYIETKVELDINSLKDISEIWDKWYNLDSLTRNIYINLAMKGNCSA